MCTEYGVCAHSVAVHSLYFGTPWLYIDDEWDLTAVARPHSPLTSKLRNPLTETKDYTVHGCLQLKFTKKWVLKLSGYLINTAFTMMDDDREEMEIFTTKFSLDDQYVTIGLGDGRIQVLG